MQIIIEPNGDVRMVENSAVDASLLGIGVCRRASNVLPRNPVLRAVFRYLRDRFGETGRVAAFTRRWPCLWMAELIDGPTFGPFRNRADAIAAEVAYLERNVL